MAGGLGEVPVAPGTAGSLLGVLLFVGFAFAARSLGVGPLAASTASPPASVGLLPVYSLACWLVYAFGVLILLVAGVWASGRAEIDFDCHDDRRIVIDEVVGQLIALSPLLFYTGTSAFLPFFSWVVTGFVLFRLFDIWKPGAVRWAECRFDGGGGVMADDVVAGFLGAVVLFLALPGGIG